MFTHLFLLIKKIIASFSPSLSSLLPLPCIPISPYQTHASFSLIVTVTHINTICPVCLLLLVHIWTQGWLLGIRLPVKGFNLGHTIPPALSVHCLPPVLYLGPMRFPLSMLDCQSVLSLFKSCSGCHIVEVTGMKLPISRKDNLTAYVLVLKHVFC